MINSPSSGDCFINSLKLQMVWHVAMQPMYHSISVVRFACRPVKEKNSQFYCPHPRIFSKLPRMLSFFSFHHFQYVPGSPHTASSSILAESMHSMVIDHVPQLVLSGKFCHIHCRYPLVGGGCWLLSACYSSYVNFILEQKSLSHYMVVFCLECFTQPTFSVIIMKSCF